MNTMSTPSLGSCMSAAEWMMVEFVGYCLWLNQCCAPYPHVGTATLWPLNTTQKVCVSPNELVSQCHTMLQVAAHYSMQLKDPQNLWLWGKIFLTSLPHLASHLLSHLEMVSSWVMDFSMNLEKSSALETQPLILEPQRIHLKISL
jgi:hypothetical protein